MEEDMPEPIHTPPWSDIVMYWLEGHVAVAFQSDVPLSQGADKVISSLRLDDLAQFLKLRGFGLKPFGAEYVVQSSTSSTPPNNNQPPNPYGGTGGSADNSGRADISMKVGKYLFASPLSQGIPIHSAMTNWFSCTTCFAHGGSATPPFPVPTGDSCATDPGNWHISLPDLSSSPI